MKLKNPLSILAALFIIPALAAPQPISIFCADKIVCTANADPNSCINTKENFWQYMNTSNKQAIKAQTYYLTQAITSSIDPQHPLSLCVYGTLQTVNIIYAAPVIAAHTPGNQWHGQYCGDNLSRLAPTTCPFFVNL